METTPKPIEFAQAHLVAVLSDERSAYDLDRENPFASLVSEILRHLCSTRDEFEREAAYAQRELESVLPYVRGGAARWNSLGILQSTGARIDQLAGLFSSQASYAKSALCEYYAFGEEEAS